MLHMDILDTLKDNKQDEAMLRARRIAQLSSSYELYKSFRESEVEISSREPAMIQRADFAKVFAIKPGQQN